ncbi:MAG: ABC transporter transmembrane domain-containing protein, partial [Thermoflexibacter sp.]|nr:ABC transporter transmembrane domain-containing protein [Thermoflexibacter sp.]
LKAQTAPVILNVVIDGKMQHYWVCYGYEQGKGFLIGDPAKGMDFYTETQVGEAWKSKGLLTLAPTQKFEKQKVQNKQRWVWLWALVKEDITLLAISVVLGIAIAGLGLSTALFSQKLIDDILPSENQSKLIYGVTLLAFLLLARTGLAYLRGFLLNKQSADFNNRLINRFFSILLYLPKPFFDTRKTGDLVARMNNARRIQNTISFLGGNVIIDVLVVLISTFYVFQYQTGIGLLSLLSIPIYFLLMRLYHKDVRNSQREVMSAYAQNESNYTFPRWRRTYTFIRWAKAIAGIGARLVPPTATSAP